nr:hypothetical protein BaRGS_027883 [Batillaria attramentaria]
MAAKPKEEARRKKYGIILKKYNPDDQPWLLKIGSGKQARKYKGVREGTITENTSYYIFTQCHDGAFEAFPVEEWYNFAPTIRYKYLNSEEAEEEFSRRDKTLNYFNIMVKKRMQSEDKAVEGEEVEKTKGKKKSKRQDRDFMLTDMDDMLEMSDDDDDRESEDDGERDDNEKPNKGKKGKQAGKGKRVKNAKQNSDDEAVEESDEGDYDDREVDYMSDSNSSSSSEPEAEEKKYAEKGVEEEAGLRKILDSDAEDEDEEEAKEEEEVEEEKEKEEEKPAKEKTTKGESDSSSSSSDSDSDIDKDEKIASALLMQKDRLEKKKTSGEKSEKSGDSTDSKAVKRKADGDGPAAKKSRTDSPLPSAGGSANEGITEEAIRRYLQRKPMTTKDLLQKFRSKKLNMTREQMTHTIAQLLKRINPDRSTINKKLYLSLKKPE